ncbi:trypsin-like serine protease [Kitasatospora viridis]|uniref:D-mannose binding lectin n=1 Tax=Kitasatospora viridis TaxID=281105 RepID=A0A561SER6_9ACTN|nr:trypsin-like serine protease [Kitasatospora viridis]TWF73356.1 D-mannose binding lectin [Kitasatospora viridis]
MATPHPRTAWLTALTGAAIAAGTLTGTPAAALTGDPTPNGSYAFTAKLDIGAGNRVCTGTLVDPSWILTAAGCFADDPARATALPAGAPKDHTTATVGGVGADVVQLVPRQDRDLVLAKLSHPVFGTAPAAVATVPATPGDALRVVGWGRTKDEWLPQQTHTGTTAVTAADATALTLTPKTAGGAVCKGDAGAPVLREKNGGVELTGIATRSWQGGCLDETETRNSALASRTDDLAGWVGSTVAQGGPVLAPGTRIESGRTVTGKDLQLAMQADGNLVVTHRGISGGVLWSSNTGGNPGAYATVQEDGNFVVYRAGASGGTGALWASGTFWSPGSYVRLQDDGNIVVYKKDGGTETGGALWSTGTQQFAPVLVGETPIRAARWTSARSTVLEMQPDGNLVLYRKSDGVPLWSSKTSGNPGAWLAMQADGNVVVYRAGASGGTGALWASGTFWSPGAYLKLQDDGNLVVYKKDGGTETGGALWSTSTFA